jgi:hypothetical protein
MIFKTLMRVELGRKPGKARKENGLIRKCTLALILAWSPWEKEQQLRISGFANGCPPNPVARIFKAAADDSPSPWGEGRVEGGKIQLYGISRSRWGWWSRFQRLKAASLVSAKRNCNVGDSTWPSQNTTLALP